MSLTNCECVRKTLDLCKTLLGSSAGAVIHEGQCEQQHLDQ